MTINTAGLLLLFGWACYVLLTWMVNRFLPSASVQGAAVVGSMYLLAVGGLLAYMATQGWKFSRHLTYQGSIARNSAPVRYWLLTLSMGAIGMVLLGAGAYALVRTLLFK
jgi:hypothetical protein